MFDARLLTQPLLHAQLFLSPHATPTPPLPSLTPPLLSPPLSRGDGGCRATALPRAARRRERAPVPLYHCGEAREWPRWCTSKRGRGQATPPRLGTTWVWANAGNAASLEHHGGEGRVGGDEGKAVSAIGRKETPDNVKRRRVRALEFSDVEVAGTAETPNCYSWKPNLGQKINKTVSSNAS